MKIRHKRWIKWSLELAMLFCLVLPSLKGINWASDGSAGKNDTRLHYIVQFWHADGTHEDKEDVNDFLENGGESPKINVKSVMRESETFSGFATAAGHDAVVRKLDEDNPDNSTLTIKYQEDIHLAKVNVFYKSKEKEKEGKDLGADETRVTEGIKYYNTSQEGLHTDKTANEIEGSNGREFELTLESWFVGGDVADVGMVLDASGSMAFTSDDLEPIHLDEEEIKKNGFDRMRLLSQKEVDKLLDKNYTDNSKLAYSGYTYFVYDTDSSDKKANEDTTGNNDNKEESSEPANEFVPIGYWNGKVKGDPSGLPELDKLTGYYSFDNSNERCNQAEVKRGERTKEDVTKDDEKRVYVVPKQTGSDKKPEGKIKFSKSNKPEIIPNTLKGFNNTGRALDLVATYNKDKKENYAAVLDINPNSDDSFTISFAVNGSSSKPVVWIGEEDQTEEKNQAWYAIYADTEQGKTTVASGIGTPTKDVNAEEEAEDTEEEKNIQEVTADLPKKNDWALCTYIFNKNNNEDKKMDVTIYVNGKRVGNGEIDNIHLGSKTKPYVVLGGSAWAHDFGGNDWDKTVDDENDTAGNDEDDTTKNVVRYMIDELFFYECALNEQQVEQYYDEIMDPASGTKLYAATAPLDPNKTIARLNNADVNGDGEGWYLVSSDSDWDLITSKKKDLLSGKRYNGIPRDEVIFNQINYLPSKTNVSDSDRKKGNTSGYIYTKNGDFSGEDGKAAITKEEGYYWNGSIIFYIDNAGYLRCFYNSGNKQQRGGEKDGSLNLDEGSWNRNESHCSYVYKKGDLQRVKTEALQRALGSFVSRLGSVSPDSRVSAVRFSSEKIEKGQQLVMLDWTKNTMESTGMFGLQRGEEHTAIDSDQSENGKEQYNYVLTGGTTTYKGLQSYLDNLDNELDKNARNKALILFTDGKDTTIGKEGEQKAIELADILKTDKKYTIYCVMLQTAGKPNPEAISFLEKLASKEEYVYTAEDVKTLTDKFTNDILDKIVSNLSDYVVQDYIDPRFDLVDADDNVIHLNAAGNIVIEDKKGNKKTVSVGKEGYNVKITKTTKTDAAGTVGEMATIFYDADKEMYYLKWEDQTIPGCNKDAKNLNVWKSRIHVRAKEDFIGGNKILTNGNDGQMNMIYHPEDTDKSSGKDDMKGGYDDDGKMNDYPSKGFPRTTVNVDLLELQMADTDDKIYMGQEMNPPEKMDILGTQVKNKVYYEYLERYAKQVGANAQQQVEQLKKGQEIRIPYYYLPDKEGNNQTGGGSYKSDQIGWLTYKWTECDSIKAPKVNPVYGPFETKDTGSRYYQLSISYIPLSEKERKDAEEEKEEKLITDPDYGYQELKSAVGDEQKDEKRDSAIHRTDIVRGELILEARVLLEDLKYLAEKNGKLNLVQEFGVARTYNGMERLYGTVKVSFAYTIDKLNKMTPDKNGYVSIFSKPLEPLPLGKYTLLAGSQKPFSFSSIKAEKIVDGNKLFVGQYGGKESGFAADCQENNKDGRVSFYMGVSRTEGDSEIDLDARLGHVVVTYTVDVPTPTPTASPTPKNTPKPKKKTDKKTKRSSPTPQPNTNIDDKLPTGRKNLGDPNGGPKTGDTAEPVHALLLMIVAAVLTLSVVVEEYRKKRQKKS